MALPPPVPSSPPAAFWLKHCVWYLVQNGWWKLWDMLSFPESLDVAGRGLPVWRRAEWWACSLPYVDVSLGQGWQPRQWALCRKSQPGIPPAGQTRSAELRLWSCCNDRAQAVPGVGVQCHGHREFQISVLITEFQVVTWPFCSLHFPLRLRTVTYRIFYLKMNGKVLIKMHNKISIPLDMSCQEFIFILALKEWL